MKDFNLQEEFIGYWDKVINIWLNKPEDGDAIVEDAKRPIDNNKECFYKDNNLSVRIEKDQSWWFEDKNKKKTSLRKLLCPIHLPEPYWGDPDDCSIVIVNYNPAGGEDINQHSYRGEGKPYPKNTMIDYVFENDYSKLAKDFPILDSYEKLKGDKRFWLRSYGGRDWWRGKIKWMRHLVLDSNEEIDERRWPAVDEKKKPYEWPEDKSIPRPFVIELCGWHSANWSSNNIREIGNDDNLKKSVHQHFVIPLLQAIENSSSQMAVCIGIQFGVLEEFYKDNKDTKFSFSDITNNIEIKKENETYVCEEWADNDTKTSLFVLSQKDIDNIPKISDEAKKSIAVKKVTITTDKSNKPKENPVIRYYRVYNVVYNDVDHLILNTFAPGSNHHPAQEFWPFEKILIKKMKVLNFNKQK